MILVKDITAKFDRCLNLQECALTQENLAASGAESLYQTLSHLHSKKTGPTAVGAAVAPCCAVQLAPLLVRTSALAGMPAHGIRN